MIGKTRHAGTSSHQSVDHSTLPSLGPPSDGEVHSEKENQYFSDNKYRNNSLIESSDDDFDLCKFNYMNATFSITMCDDIWNNVSFPFLRSFGMGHTQS